MNLVFSYIYNPIIIIFFLKTLLERYSEGRITILMLMFFTPIIIISTISLFKIYNVYKIVNNTITYKKNIIDDFSNFVEVSKISKIIIYGNVIFAILLLLFFGIIGFTFLREFYLETYVTFFFDTIFVTSISIVYSVIKLFFYFNYITKIT